MTYTCDSCHVCSCEEKNRDLTKVPKNCPMLDEKSMAEILVKYSEPKIRNFYYVTKTCRHPDTGIGFLVPRLRSVIDFCKAMGYKKIGLAFCVGLRNEAELYSKILRSHNLQVVSVCCCNCGFNRPDLGVPLPDGIDFHAACNPIGQAYLLNKENVEFNLVMGLCTGHDSLFMKYADAMSTVVIVKDPATGHSPASALYLYDQYYKRIFDVPSFGEDEDKSGK